MIVTVTNKNQYTNEDGKIITAVTLNERNPYAEWSPEPGVTLSAGGLEYEQFNVGDRFELILVKMSNDDEVTF